MAVSSGWTHGGLLQTAGIAPASYGMDIYTGSEQGMVVVPTVDAQSIEPGEDLYVPKIGAETVTTLYAKTTTDGSTYSKTTDLQGNQISFAAIDDSAVQLMEKFQYVGMAHAKVAWDRMPQSRRIAYLNARKNKASIALGAAKDSSILSLALPGLNLTANKFNASTPASMTIETVWAIIELFKNQGYEGQIEGWLAPNQIPTMFSLKDWFWGYNTTGVAGGAPRNLEFNHANVRIRFHNGVYSDDEDGRHGFFYAPMAVGFRDVIGMDVDDWYDGDTKSYKTSPDTDYAYGIIDNTLTATVQTPLNLT